VTIGFAPSGTLTLEDHRTGEVYRQLLRLTDEVDAGDSYTVWVPPRSRASRQVQRLSHEVVAAGPLVGAVQTRCELPAASAGTIAIRRLVTLHADSPLVRIRLDVVNRSRGHRLRLGLPVRVGGPAIAGAAFGHEWRGTPAGPVAAPPAEAVVATAPAHRYVAVAEAGRGLAVFQPGFFEYEWTPGGELRCTVLRAIGDLALADLPPRLGAAGWHVDVPDAQEPGLHRLELGLLPIDAATLEQSWALEREWEDAFLPVSGRFLRDFTGEVPPSGLRLEGDGLVLSALKPSEDGGGVILRCWNAREVPVNGAVTFAVAPAAVHVCDATEQRGSRLPIRRGRRVDFEVAPRSLVSLRLEYVS
jgi:alpha-mannosidase